MMLFGWQGDDKGVSARSSASALIAVTLAQDKGSTLHVCVSSFDHPAVKPVVVISQRDSAAYSLLHVAQDTVVCLNLSFILTQ